MKQRRSLHSRKVWLFDLDNTLHNASHAIFPAINRNMNSFIARILGEGMQPADEVTVNAIRQTYYQRYGVTMLGMVKHHDVRAEVFLQEVHHFDDLANMIRAERGLGRVLRGLPGKKILLTNAPRFYSRKVLQHLNIHRQFSRHISVEDMRVHGKLQPKPSRPFLRQFLAANRLRASDCVLVEDSLDNLRAAKREGLHTVWVRSYIPDAQKQNRVVPQHASCVDIRLSSVLQLHRHLRRMA